MPEMHYFHTLNNHTPFLEVCIGEFHFFPKKRPGGSLRAYWRDPDFAANAAWRGSSRKDGPIPME